MRGACRADVIFKAVVFAAVFFTGAVFFTAAFLDRRRLGTAGFAIIGTIFAAVAINTRMSEVMLPILQLPISLPLLISEGPLAPIWRVAGKADLRRLMPVSPGMNNDVDSNDQEPIES